MPSPLKATLGTPGEGGLTLLRSHVLHATAREHAWQGAAGLSIKTFRGGEARYNVGHGTFLVEPGRYLILEESQPYTITIESHKPVESLCVFFKRGLAGEVLGTMDGVLDAKAPADPSFVPRTDAIDSRLGQALDRVRSLGGPGEDGHREEAIHALLELLLHAERHFMRRAEALSSLKASTRHELLRRLSRARDFMGASLEAPLSLQDMAAVACLSPAHFLRTFRELYGRTPHEALTQMRMEKAKALLRAGGSVTQTALAVGFTSLPTFSRTFKRRVGTPPQSFHKLRIPDKQAGRVGA